MDFSIFQKDIAELGAGLAQGLEAQVFGSWSDRNPGAGKMRTCPLCRARRREFGTEKCCNTAHATSKRAWTSELGFHQEPCEPRVTQEISKSMIKKMLHKRHGQNRDWHRREMTRRMQEDFHFVESAGREMFSRPCLKWVDIQKMLPDAAGIPAFAEKYLTWKSSKARAKRG
jgi:hypothetical protein